MASSSSSSPSLASSKVSGGSSKSSAAAAPDDANRGKAPPPPPPPQQQQQQQAWEWKSVKAHRNPQDDLGFGRSSAKSPRDDASSRSWEEMEEDKDKKEDAPNSSSLMGLNLGKRTYEEQKGAASSPPAAAAPPSTTPPPASSTPPKKGRGCAQTSVVPKCQVEGCQADLSSSKDYHRRHKVCEVHSKTPKNTVNGQEQRFCQQCSRFHLLAEFDEGKRSCRRRLQGHNERRRKPQPDTLAAYNMGNASFQAAAYQRLGVGSSIIVDGHNDHALTYGATSWGRLGRDQFLSKQLVENLSPEKLLLLLQNSKRSTGLPTISSSSSSAAASTNASSMAKQQQDHMKLSLSSSSGVGGGGGGGVGGGGLSPVLDSGRALSLLSSDTWAKSSTGYELSAGSSLQAQATSPATHASSQYILTASSIGGDGGSLSPKTQAHQAHQYHHHHHHHHHQQQQHHQGFQAQDAIPITTGGNSSKQQQQQHQEQSYSSPLGMNRF